jgi:acetyl esterase/lipase
MAIALFVLGLLAALVTLLGLLSPRRPYVAVPITFFASWLAQDLAPFHLAAQVLVTALLVALGALASSWGVAGLVLMVLSWVGLAVLWWWQRAAAPALDAGLRELLGEAAAGPSVAAEKVPLGVLLRPFNASLEGVTRVKGLTYGEHRRHRLDVLKPADGRTGCPVLLQVHGGGWIIGNKREQGQPLMRHLARNGWVCVAINYRLSPKAKFPDHLVDVKRAIAWIREHAAEHGGDPGYVAITGGSAGGHLCALAALTANDPRFQPGFEHVDTSLKAAVPFYGVYDFLDRNDLKRQKMTPLLQKYVMQCDPQAGRALWEAASPLDHVRADAPPFLVIEGAVDTLVWREEAHEFVRGLRAVSSAPVGYVEIPHAQHAFDVMVNRRSVHTVRAVERFLEWVRAGA